MAKVFIGIPTYRRPEMIRSAVHSLLRQSFTDWRCIVSDNPSGENAGGKIRQYLEQLADPRITFFQQPENHGEYGQGRFFINSLQEESYFMILHDDDVLSETYLEKAVQCLEDHPSASLFVANPAGLTVDGRKSKEYSDWYLRSHGRTRARRGYVDILESLFDCGFVPISGTLFRAGDLLESGFVDDDFHGNFPFEFNVLYRLGLTGGKGWFEPEELLAFRFHDESLRSARLMMDPNVVNTMIRLLERYPLHGRLERRRQVLLGRLFRARALIGLWSGEDQEVTADLRKALRCNPYALRTVLVFALHTVSPALVKKVFARPANVASPPKMKPLST